MRLLMCILGVWAALGPVVMHAGQSTAGRVLVVHSYHRTQKGHVVEMARGIDQAFAGSEARLRHVYMDTKRHPDHAFKVAAGRRALDAMKTFRPDVVIALDDNAQAFFVKEAMVVADAPVFIFGGVNADPAVYGYPRKNVTGVLERPNIRESLELLLKIRPGVKRVAMLSDNSKTAELFIQYCQSLDLPVEVAAYVQPATLEEWTAAIDRYKDRVDAFGIYVLRTIREKTGEELMVPEGRLMEILNRRTDLPTVGFFDSAARAGVLCGISVSMMEQGYEAGRIARAVLEGRSVEDFPMKSTRRGRIQLNLIEAERLGIDLDWKIISKADVVVR